MIQIGHAYGAMVVGQNQSDSQAGSSGGSAEPQSLNDELKALRAQLADKERELEQVTDDFEKAQEIGNLGSWILHVKSGKVEWSAQQHRIFGQDPSKPVPSLEEQESWYTARSWKAMNAAVERSIKTGCPYSIELEAIRKDGSIATLISKGQTECDENGEVVILRGIALDVSESKILENELRAQKKFADEVCRLSPAGIFIHHQEHDSLVFANEQFSSILGYSSDDFQGDAKEVFESLVHPDDTTQLKEVRSSYKGGPRVQKSECRFKNSDGRWVWCGLIEAPFKLDAEGNLISTICVLMDINEIKENESKLKLALKQAKVAQVYKDQFLSNMSHEIRTPMNGVVAFSSLLREDDIDSVTRNEYIDRIDSCSNQLLNLIDDIIDNAKIEAGELKIEKKAFSLEKLTRDTIETIEKLKAKKGKAHLSLSVSMPEGNENHKIYSDPLRIQQILINLLTNALKFSDKGNIELGYEISDDGIAFYVEDEGIGIAPERVALVFERFEHLEGKDKKYEGTGLGLSISKGLANLLGGDFRLQSEHGVGSRFELSLPIELIEEDEVPKEKEAVPLAQSTKVSSTLLVVDDEETNRDVFSLILRKKPFDVLFASDGEEAVEVYRSHPEIDLVLMDIRMPIMTGEEAAQEILKINADAKIIAQTAFAMQEEKDRLKSLGFIDHLSKPYRLKDLMAIISRWVNVG